MGICYLSKGSCPTCRYYRKDEKRLGKKSCTATQSQMLNLAVKKNPVGLYMSLTGK